MTIMSDKTLPIVVAALAGSLIGVLLGLWLGARGEQSALVDLITRAELSTECRAELDRGIKSIIEDWEGPPAPRNKSHIGLRALTAAAKVPSSR